MSSHLALLLKYLSPIVLSGVSVQIFGYYESGAIIGLLLSLVVFFTSATKLVIDLVLQCMLATWLADIVEQPQIQVGYMCGCISVSIVYGAFYSVRQHKACKKPTPEKAE